MKLQSLKTGVLAGVLILAATDVLRAQSVGTVSFQGLIKDTNGNPVNGPVTLEFRIYDAETNGNLLWSEIHPSVPTARGLFSVSLGSASEGIPDNALDYKRLDSNATAAWLGIVVNGGPELAPRTRFGAVPYSAKAISAEGLVKPGTLQQVVSVDENNLRIFNDDGTNPVVIGAADECGVVTLRDQDMNARIVLDTRSPGHIRAPRLVVNAGYSVSEPTVSIRTHSDYTYPNRTSLIVEGGVTDQSPKYFRVYTDGGDPYALKASVDGKFIAQVIQITGGSDLAEPFSVGESGESCDAIEPGMVVVIDPANPGKVKLAGEPYDRKVAGIISGAYGLSPGMVMKAEGQPHADGEHPVALAGRVWCWCDASVGSIEPGDRLTTSGTLGHAMKAIDKERADGAVIGKAMTKLETGTGLVLVLVQPH